MVLLYIATTVMAACGLWIATGASLCQHLGIFSLDLIFDSYSNAFLLLLFLISSHVLVWSYYYMDKEANYRRFVGLVLAFLCSIYTLVLCSSLYGALIGWDGLGVTSFLLVIYFKNRNSLGSGLITAMINRVGDCFLLVLLALQLTHLFNTYVFTVLLLLTSITNSAQFPFSSWLPAAIAAPTPVSALVHSSTLVTAGIYLLLRFNSVGTEWLLLVGSVTIIIAGLCACAEIDLNKIVALSTLSQLGVIVVALAIKLKVLCFFHLITHAMFKALLFISVGMGIHSVYGSQDFRSFAAFGSVSALPSACLSIANLSLAGFPFIAGFYSNDAILEAFYNSSHSFTLLAVFLVGVGLTTAYSVKMTVLAVVGGHSGGAVSLCGGGSGCVAKWPLLVLSLCAVLSGSFLCVSMGVGLTTIGEVDNIIPLFLILVGVFTGIYLDNFKKSILSQLWFLTPSVQLLARFAGGQGHAGELDRGLYPHTLSTSAQWVLLAAGSSARWLSLVASLMFVTFIL